MVESYSRLGRLYTYSKDTAFAAQENFTTEALAMAIADDPGPMIEALQRVAGAATGTFVRNAAGLRPSTQVSLPGGGRLDLVLEVLDERHRTTGEVWLEVKIDAPESGDQLAVYERRAKGLGNVWLLTLARAPIRPSVPNLTWNELYRAARRASIEHASWRDLRTFLEEQHVANDAMSPMSDREAASLEAAYAVMQKVSEVVLAVHRSLPTLFPQPVASKLMWRAEGALLNYIGLIFRASGELVGVGGPVTYGLISQDGTAYWVVAVRAGAATRATFELARQMADQAGFAADWDRPATGPSILVARTRATAVPTHEAAVTWFENRLRDLAASGIVETLTATAAERPIETDPAVLEALNGIGTKAEAS